MVSTGDSIPPWEMPSVSAEKMKTMAAILRDPNPLHWDRDAVDALPLGLGKRTINQGPLGLSYIVNMLHAWAGAGSIRRLVMRFPQVVLDADCVIAQGTVTGVREETGETLVDCSVWLWRDEGGKLLEGEATVCLSNNKQ